MIEKNNEDSSRKNSSQLPENKENEISNFKLLYQNTSNPEKDNCSGVNSDEETTSSSLVPIPDTLKQIRNKSRWTVSEAGGSPVREMDTSHGSEILGKSAENIVNSLEELRKKYALKNESSVALKMNSANMMLDDILSSPNLKKASNESLQYKFFKELRPNVTENESSTTESSVTNTHHCPHILNQFHVPMSLDYSPSPNHRHCSAIHPLYSSPCSPIKEINPQNNNKKKSFLEKLHDFQIRYKIQSVYKTFRKSILFSKNKGLDGINAQQGIPGAGYQGNSLNKNEPSLCKFDHSKCPLGQYPKKMVLDLVELSEVSQSEFKSTEEDCQCTCVNHKERCQCTCIKQKYCNCPEIMPKCICVKCNDNTSELTSESLKPNSLNPDSSRKSIEKKQATHPVTPQPTKKENYTGWMLEGNKNNRKRKTNSLCKNTQGWKKYCSEERNLMERTDIYYFDHGNSAYYQTTDNHPVRYTECLVERTDEYATRFWAEIFGTIEIGVAFLISFFLQLYRFLFTSIIRSLTVGLLQIFSDYFFKPLLTILFNGILQPCLILAYNIAISVRDLCLPISQTFGFFLKEIANILKSWRFVEVNRNKTPSCYCGNKV